MRNARSEFRLQVCGDPGVASKFLKDYIGDRDVWYALVLDKVNGDPARRANPDAKEVTREDAKKLFILLLHQCSSIPWF